MNPWSGIPFLRFTLAFSSGILFYLFVLSQPVYGLPVVCCLFVYLLLFLLQRYRKEYFYFLQPWLGCSALCCLFLLGGWTGQLRDERYSPDHLLNASTKCSFYQAVISSVPEEKAKTYKAEAEIEKSRVNARWETTEGKVILYIPKNAAKLPQFGDRILIAGCPEIVKAPLNPEEFDYKRYLRFYHIYHTQFLKEGSYRVLAHDQGNALLRLAFFLRTEALHILNKYIKDKAAAGVASALLLGIRGTMDQETRDIYSHTGTTHVLAVSGLHVAVVFQILLLLFCFVRSARMQRIAVPLLLLLALWLYILITGFCPSVLRAGVMFTMVILARMLGKNANVYNSLFCSAFFLLCIDPFMLMDTGFQLSYLAVLGILYFGDRIYHRLEIQNRILDSLWMMTALSLAAQITTLPLTICYFHQVPLTFLIANLVAIPLSNFVLYSGTLLLALSFFAPAARGIAWVVETLIWIMNKFLAFLAQIPFSSLKGFSLHPWEVLLLYILILAIVLFIRQKRLVYAAVSCLSVFLLCFSSIIHITETRNQKRFIVFNIKNHHAMAFLKGDEAIVVADSALKNSDKYARHILPYLTQKGIVSIKWTDSWLKQYTTNDYTLFTFNGKSVLWIKSGSTEQPMPSADIALAAPSQDYILSTVASTDKILLNTKGRRATTQRQGIYDMKELPAFETEL